MSSNNSRAAIDRKRARQTGKRTTVSSPWNRQLFASFVDSLPGFAWMKDHKGRYLYVNRSVREMIPAYSPDYLGKTDNEIWPADIANELVANDQTVIATRREVQAIEQYLVGAETRYVLVTKFPILNARGDVGIVGGISINVTEQVHAMEQLRKLTKRKREILQLIARGKNTKEVASLLQISPKTVETHRSRLMAQLNIHDVAGLVRYAVRANLISIG